MVSRPALNTLRAIVSTSHLVMIFRSFDHQIVIVIVHVNQRMARQCYVDSLKKEGNISTNVELDPIHSSSKALSPPRNYNAYNLSTINTKAPISGSRYKGRTKNN
ncbi:hypothetical protein CR513_45778, partial [Mucuna pruriens]